MFGGLSWIGYDVTDFQLDEAAAFMDVLRFLMVLVTVVVLLAIRQFLSTKVVI